MTDPARSLTPDDTPELMSLRPEEEETPPSPHIVVAGMAVLATLLLLAWLPLPTSPPWALVVTALGVGLATYMALFGTTRPLPLNILAAAAGALGALWGMPESITFPLTSPPTETITAILTLVAGILLGGIVGLTIGFGMYVERSPRKVLVICFLFTFVSATIWFIFTRV